MKGTFRRVSISSYKNKKRETNSSTVRQPLLSQKPLTDKDETNRSEEVMESGSSHQISPCKKFQQHHGIPAVPMAKRSASEVLIRPVVYVDCEFDASIELPFGEDSIAANIRDIRRREKEREASARYLQWCLYAFIGPAPIGCGVVYCFRRPDRPRAESASSPLRLSSEIDSDCLPRRSKQDPEQCSLKSKV